MVLNAWGHQIRVPDVVEPITAWRAWFVPTSAYSLHSTTYRQLIWKPGEAMKAQCHPQELCRDLIRSDWGNNKRCRYAGDDPETHAPPHKSGNCGFYSYKHPAYSVIGNCVGANSLGSVTTLRGQPGRIVCGTVEIWGRVIEHEHGYRSEYARFKRVTHTFNRRTLEVLLEKHGYTCRGF